MDPTNIAKELIDFNKNAIKMNLDAISALSGQAAKGADQLLGVAPNVPEESKKAVGLLFQENQKALTSLKKYLESGMAIDWSAKEATAKNLENLELLYNQAFSQAGNMRNETKALFEKAGSQLPKEAKSLVEFWSTAVNNGYDICQTYMNKNFELGKKILAEVAALTPKV